MKVEILIVGGNTDGTDYYSAVTINSAWELDEFKKRIETYGIVHNDTAYIYVSMSYNANRSSFVIKTKLA